MDEPNRDDEGSAPACMQDRRLPPERLNSTCFCSSLDRQALQHALADELGGGELYALVEQRCPYLFAARPVFVSETQARRIDELVHAIEAVLALPAYRRLVLENAPDIARHDPGGPIVAEANDPRQPAVPRHRHRLRPWILRQEAVPEGLIV